ncbi:MAG: hypothetical protein KAR12_16635 [Methylococcales bacterium]|nr:hypothetical protein [Methylococcales bacterium]
MDKIEFNIKIRKPKYPVIVVSAERLYSAFNIKQLAKSCISSTPIEGKDIIQVIDSTGEEFWYSPEYYILTPGFSFKKWTKKHLIEVFNCSSNAKDSMQEYSIKSLSTKRLEKIVGDICELLRSNPNA